MTNIFTSGTIGSTNGTIGVLDYRYCSGFYGHQWYQYQPMAPTTKLPMVPLAEAWMQPLLDLQGTSLLNWKELV